MGYIFKEVIYYVSQVIIYLIIAHVLLSYVMSSTNPIRVMIDRLVLPMLNPIRRVVPLIGMIDISPIILIILVQLMAWLLTFLITILLR